MLSQDIVSKYIVGIVLIVAVVGILTVLTQSLGSDISGQAIKMPPKGTLDSDKDGVLNLRDKCPGYDDKVDTDSDGTPDGCDDDELPDLVGDEDSLSLWVEGDVYYKDSQVVGSTLDDITFTCGIRNDGTATATGSYGYAYHYCYIYDESGGTYYSPSTRYKSTEISAGETETWTTTTHSGDSDDTGLWPDILQEIYNGGGDVYIKYDIDSSTVYYVTESDETNNEEEFYIPLDSSMYSLTWIEAECTTKSDCSSECECGERTSSLPYTCIDTETRTACTS